MPIENSDNTRISMRTQLCSLICMQILLHTPRTGTTPNFKTKQKRHVISNIFLLHIILTYSAHNFFFYFHFFVS